MSPERKQSLRAALDQIRWLGTLNPAGRTIQLYAGSTKTPHARVQLTYAIPGQTECPSERQANQIAAMPEILDSLIRTVEELLAEETP